MTFIFLFSNQGAYVVILVQRSVILLILNVFLFFLLFFFQTPASPTAALGAPAIVNPLATAVTTAKVTYSPTVP